MLLPELLAWLACPLSDDTRYTAGVAAFALQRMGGLGRRACENSSKISDQALVTSWCAHGCVLPAKPSNHPFDGISYSRDQTGAIKVETGRPTSLPSSITGVARILNPAPAAEEKRGLGTRNHETDETLLQPPPQPRTCFSCFDSFPLFDSSLTPSSPSDCATHARPLLPAALAFVPYGFILV